MLKIVKKLEGKKIFPIFVSRRDNKTVESYLRSNKTSGREDLVLSRPVAFYNPAVHQPMNFVLSIVRLSSLVDILV